MPGRKREPSPKRLVKDFFKPYTVPKIRVPVYDGVEEEINVASARSDSPDDNVDTLRPPPLTIVSCHSHPPSSPSPSAEQGTPRPTAKLLHQAASNDPPSSKSSSPRHRVMEAVEIPPPRSKPTDTVNTVAVNPITTSFSSSLSSVPVSTQSSSRRVVKNGIHAVTNSDSGSADSSSSEDELADADTFVPRKKIKLASPVRDNGSNRESLGESKASTRQSLRLSDNSRRPNRVNTPIRASSPARPAYKHSLVKMVKQQQTEDKADQRIRQMEAEYDALEQRQANDDRTGSDIVRATHAAVGDDSDDGQRMMLAMSRIEAGDVEDEFHYFVGLRDDRGGQSFPAADSVADNLPPWLEKTSDELWRTHACLTGFLAECVAKDGLPVALQDWFADQLLHEPREDLCEAYTSVLESCRASSLETTAERFGSLRRFFYLSDTPTAKSSRHAPSTSVMSGQLRSLPYATRAIRHYSSYRCDATIVSTILELMYTSIDSHVSGDANLRVLAGESIEDLWQCVEDEEQAASRLSAALRTSTLSLQLKCRAVACLPTNSDRSHHLRRYMALGLLCDSEVQQATTSTVHVNRVLRELKTRPEFQISDATDYVLLNALTTILDISLDAGFSKEASDPASAMPCPIKPGADVMKASVPRTEKDPGKAFNAQIDGFIDQLNVISSRIKDAGSTHLRRTEAKLAIERLTKRLEYGVRTKPRPQKRTFGGMTGEGPRIFLDAFFKRAEKDQAEASVHSDRDSGGPASPFQGDSMVAGAATDGDDGDEQ